MWDTFLSLRPWHLIEQLVCLLGLPVRMNCSMKIRLSEPLDSNPLFQRVLDTLRVEKLTGKAGPSQFCVVWIWSLVYKMSDVLEATTRQKEVYASFCDCAHFFCGTVCSLKKPLSLLVFRIVEVQGHSLLLLRNKDICSLQCYEETKHFKKKPKSFTAILNFLTFY